MSDPPGDGYVVFVEFPVDNIVGVHWEDAGGEGGPGPDLGPPYCGRYGYGARVENTGALVTAVPYGPNQFPPFIGTFSIANNTGPEGERYGGLNRPLLDPTITTLNAGIGLVATNIFLDAGNLTFTNNQLSGLQDYLGEFGTVGWVVPITGGQNAESIPIVIQSYSISMEWVCNHSPVGAEVGIGVSHPIVGFSGALPPPPEPALILGFLSGGIGEFSYDFKYAAWASGGIVVDTDNQFDPELGGPAFLWWMTRPAGGVWSSSGQFMRSTIIGLNDNYTWEVVATCQPKPPLT